MAGDMQAAFQEWHEQLAPLSCKVTKLSDKNYSWWQKEMIMHLKNANLWTVVSADLPDVALRIYD